LARARRAPRASRAIAGPVAGTLLAALLGAQVARAQPITVPVETPPATPVATPPPGEAGATAALDPSGSSRTVGPAVTPGAASEGYSAYEKQSIRHALDEVGGELEPHPEGKVIERVVVVRREVLDARQDLPEWLSWVDFLNIFHGTSRPYVIEQEILVRPGQRWSQRQVDETARNLRDLRPLSLVLTVPVRGTRPDQVRLLVITKDIWSLRLNTDARFAGGKLETLTLQPSEENVFGTHHSIGAQFTLEPYWYSLGARYSLRRIAGSPLAGRVDANVIINRERGEPEGSYGSFAYGAPLARIDQKWGWSGRVQWRNEVFRRTVGGVIATYDAAVTPDVDDAIPYFYRNDSVVGAVSVSRSYGDRFKHDISVSLEAERRVARTGDLSAFDPRAAAEFALEEVPVSDTRVYPAVTYQSYENRFLRTLNVDTLGLQEDYPLGHSVMVSGYPVLRAFNSTRDFLGGYVGAGYTWPLRSGFLRVAADATLEVEIGDTPRRARPPRPNECDSSVSDGSVEGTLRLVSPELPLVRLVHDVKLVHRYCNYLNKQTQLGGESRLRGYPSKLFIGKDALVANIELRTKPLVVGSVHIGGVVFYDMGDAFDGFSSTPVTPGDPAAPSGPTSLDAGPRPLQLKRSVGFGLRSLIPFLDRTVLRADVGFPLDPETIPTLAPGEVAWDLVVTFKQAFQFPSRTPTEAL
jgi:hypothetical protein